MPQDDQLAVLRIKKDRAWVDMRHIEQQLNEAGNKITHLRSSYGHQLDHLSTWRKQTIIQMQEAFENASDAFSCGDHVEARQQSDIGKKCRSLLEAIRIKRKSLIDKLTSAQATYKEVHDAYLSKKQEYFDARKQYNKQFGQAKDARRDIAIRAVIPEEYGDNVKVVHEPKSKTSAYFGGAGRPDGPGHAHYVVDQSGKLTWRREIGEARGQHNAR